MNTSPKQEHVSFKSQCLKATSVTVWLLFVTLTVIMKRFEFIVCFKWLKNVKYNLTLIEKLYDYLYSEKIGDYWLPINTVQSVIVYGWFRLLITIAPSLIPVRTLYIYPLAKSVIALLSNHQQELFPNSLWTGKLIFLLRDWWKSFPTSTQQSFIILVYIPCCLMIWVNDPIKF